MTLIQYLTAPLSRTQANIAFLVVGLLLGAYLGYYGIPVLLQILNPPKIEQKPLDLLACKHPASALVVIAGTPVCRMCQDETTAYLIAWLDVNG